LVRDAKANYDLTLIVGARHAVPCELIMKNLKKIFQKLLGCEKESQVFLYIRILFITAVILGVMACIIAQAYNFQINQADLLSAEVKKTSMRTEKITTRRGNIYDRTGERLLATSLEVPSIVFTGAPITVNKREIALNLAVALNLNFDAVYADINSNAKFRYIKRHVSDDEAFLIEKLSLPGIKIQKEKRRFYPNTELLGQVLGFVNIDQLGLYGIEEAYDSYLMSRSFKVNKMVDRKGRDIYLEGFPLDDEMNGNNVILTIDEEIQFIAEAELRNSVIENEAKGGTAIVIDPSNFEILAFAHIPGFDPNKYESLCTRTKDSEEEKDEIDICKNRGIFDRYEGGSTAKIFTVAAALEYTDLTLESVINTHGGKCKIANFEITDVHKMASGTILEIVKYSSNCGAKEIALIVGIHDMHETLTKFGFGSRTGIDLKNEVSGRVWPESEWTKTSLQTIGYGYGYSVTALQMAVAVATIANNGVRMKPHLVKKIVSSNGEIVREFAPEIVMRAVSEKTASELIKAMITVLEPGGTAARSAVEDFTAAGKTGTSKIAKSGVKGYSNRYIGSFMGIVPVEKPGLAIYVAIQEPKKAIYGGTVAGPVFKKIAEKSLRYMGVLGPTEELKNEN
jgi:cell division protein FtsI (penicillin-binding protein 3)